MSCPRQGSWWHGQCKLRKQALIMQTPHEQRANTNANADSAINSRADADTGHMLELTCCCLLGTEWGYEA
eukprot:1876566-Heterocapsa_arctica.AAC.1